MAVTIKDALYISIHGEAERLFDVVPFEIDASKFGAFTIFGYGVVWLEGFMQVVYMVNFDIFYNKIVNDKDE